MVLPALPGGAELWKVTYEPWRGETEIFTRDEWVDRGCQVIGLNFCLSKAQLLTASAAPVRSARLVVSLRLSMRGEGRPLAAGRLFRVWSRRIRRPPTQRGSRDKSRGLGPPQRSKFNLAGAPARIRQLRRERGAPRRDARSATPWPGGRVHAPCSVRPCAHGPPNRVTVRSGAAALLWPRPSQTIRSSAAPQPVRLNPDFPVISRGVKRGRPAAARAPHPPRPGQSTFRPGAPAASRLFYLVGPPRGQLQWVQVSQGHPRFGGGKPPQCCAR
ncbi:hypothetical protein NDU88_004687 [Pleurodeles waltl]|uniref:Uncharacterized protein n=1 Tax=Pleurodeles waltl TaxID=8319 RepID=A0AAV7LKN7_PLEWA|nr:hypothetical protein NDU88_004687 [Pleurodeles waltl]